MGDNFHIPSKSRHAAMCSAAITDVDVRPKSGAIQKKFFPRLSFHVLARIRDPPSPIQG